MTKKSGVFDKAKHKSGVIEGGIDALVKKVKKRDDDDFNWKDSVRVCIYAPKELRNDYKALMAKRGVTIQDDLLDHIRNTLKAAK